MARNRVARVFPPSRSKGSPVDDRIALPARTGASGSRALRQRALRWTVGSRLGLGLVRSAMNDPHVRAELLLSLSDRIVRGADYDRALEEHRALEVPGARTPPRTFDDLIWLFSSNWLNHRFSRLDLDEALYLFRLIHSIDNARVAELGRFRGGSTILFATAGGQVTSVDGNALQSAWSQDLMRVLDHLKLTDRVDLVVGDTRTHEIGPETFDVVFFDASVSADGIRAEIEHWWPAITSGGHAIFRDGRAQLPHLLPVQDTVAEFALTADAERLPDQKVPGCMVHLIKR